MNKFKAVAKYESVLDNHRWLEGKQYDLVDRGDHFIIVSEVGETRFMWEAVENMIDCFFFVIPAEFLESKVRGLGAYGL